MYLGLKTTTLFIFSVALIRYIFRGAASRQSDTYRTVIIFQGGKMGDMICTTPMFRAVKKRYPSCRVVVVGNAVNKIVLEHNPDIDSYLVFDQRKFLDTLRAIKKEKPDFGCITAPSTLGLALLYLGGIPLISAPKVENGWSPFVTRTYKIMSRFVIQKIHRMGHYVPREYLRLLEPMGIMTEDTTKYVYWSPDAEVTVREFLEQSNPPLKMQIGIMPGVGNKIKQWPAERFAEVADYLVQAHAAHIFIIGNQSNRNEIDTMVSHMTASGQATDCSHLTLDETKALISKLDMTVSVDTGQVFIAEACGVPTIDIGGVIQPYEMAPNDGEFHVLITYGGEPLISSLNSRVYDYKKAREGVESISATLVIEKIDALIEKIYKHRTETGSGVNVRVQKS